MKRSLSSSFFLVVLFYFSFPYGYNTPILAAMPHSDITPMIFSLESAPNQGYSPKAPTWFPGPTDSFTGTEVM